MVVNSFAKRKATVQQESLQDSGEALKEKEGGKRPRRSGAKDTPRKTSPKRVTVRSKKAKEADKQTPSARETDISSHNDNTFEKEEPEVTGKLEGQGNQIIRQQSKETPEVGGGATSETANPNPGTREYKVLSPGLPWTASHIEWRRRLGQNPAFLEVVERLLANRRKELETCNQELEEIPSDEEIKEEAAQL